MSKYNIKYKGLDSSYDSKIKSALESLGYHRAHIRGLTKGYRKVIQEEKLAHVIIVEAEKYVEKIAVEFSKQFMKWDGFGQHIPFTNEELEALDRIDVRLTHYHTQRLGQHIEDWFSGKDEV